MGQRSMYFTNNHFVFLQIGGTKSRFYNTMCKESEEQMAMFDTHDHKEGVTAFLTKRKPNFIGK